MKHIPRRLGALLSLLLAVAVAPALAVAASPAPASAAVPDPPGWIVFDHGDDLWTARADGSHAHRLVTAGQVGVDHLGEPALTPDGSVLLFTGWSDTHKVVSSHDLTFWGRNHMRTFELRAGHLTALSGPPRATAAARETDDLAAEPTPDGRHYVYAHYSCTEELIVEGAYDDWGRVCKSHLRRAPLPGGAAHSTAFATMCDGTTPSDELSLPNGQTPDPAAPARVAYAGCRTAGSGDPFGAPSQGALMVSGPQHRGEVEIALTGEASGFDDPSFSPDGHSLVAYNEGGEVTTLDPGGNVVVHDFVAGLYVYDDLGATTAGRLLVRTPFGDGSTLEYPRYLGPDTIGFVHDGSVYAVPAACSGCTVQDATLVHRGSGRTAAYSLAWARRAVTPYRPELRLAPVRAQHARALVRHGLVVHLACRTQCRVVLRLAVSPRQARHLGLTRRHRAVTVGHRSVHLRAGAHAVRVRLTRHARNVLRHARRWSMHLAATPHPGGQRDARHRLVHVRR